MVAPCGRGDRIKAQSPVLLATLSWNIDLGHICFTLSKHTESCACWNVEGLLFLIFFNMICESDMLVFVQIEIGSNLKSLFWNSALRRKGPFLF